MFLLLACVANKLFVVWKTKPYDCWISWHAAYSSMDLQMCCRGGVRERVPTRLCHKMRVIGTTWRGRVNNDFFFLNACLDHCRLQILSRPLCLSETLRDRETRDRDKTKTKDCQGRDKTKTTKKWSQDRSRDQDRSQELQVYCFMAARCPSEIADSF